MGARDRNRRSISAYARVVAMAAISLAMTPPLHAQVSGAARVDGVVFDSLGKRPLVGATVQLIEAPPGHGSYSAQTDSIGRFQIDSVRAGSYVAGFQHPLLDSLGIGAPFQKLSVVAGGTARVALAVPPEPTLARAICSESGSAVGAVAAKDSAGILVGHVRDANTGAPLAAAAVTLQWKELIFGSGGPHAETRELHAASTTEGWFAICNLAENEYLLHAERGSRHTGLLDVDIHRSAIARVSILLGADPAGSPADSGATPGASLSGIVTTSDGHPLEGAQVLVDGSPATASTDARGAFVLTGLPDGTRMAEARALGYEPVRERVELSRAEPRRVTIVMGKRVQTLDALTVVAKQREREQNLAGFLQRRKRGDGRYLTKEEIEQRDVQNACDLLRRVPGVHVMDDGTGSCRANIRGATTGATSAGTAPAPHLCEPNIYVDNSAFGGTLAEFAKLIPARDIVGIEVYSSATEPPQFSGACGVIVIWTRAGA
jgi:hypothetical protein